MGKRAGWYNNCTTGGKFHDKLEVKKNYVASKLGVVVPTAVNGAAAREEVRVIKVLERNRITATIEGTGRKYRVVEVVLKIGMAMKKLA